MGDYTTADLDSTLEIVEIDRATIARVVAAWGIAGDYAEWSGGFLLELKDGQFCYITGWCDTTGWGCRDGADVTYYDYQPDPVALSDGDTQWDIDPADLNRFIEAGFTY